MVYGFWQMGRGMGDRLHSIAISSLGFINGNMRHLSGQSPTDHIRIGPGPLPGFFLGAVKILSVRP